MSYLLDGWYRVVTETGSTYLTQNPLETTEFRSIVKLRDKEFTDNEILTILKQDADDRDRHDLIDIYDRLDTTLGLFIANKRDFWLHLASKGGLI